MIDQPGVYDMPADAYHADPVMGGSLSSTGARKLLPPSCPAIFDHERRNGQQHRTEFDIGHAAHALILGAGADLEVIDASDYKAKAARDARAAAYAEGRTPLLRAQFEQVTAMADAVRKHPVAGQLFQPGTGDAEKTLVWRDDESGVWCRAMVDWMPLEPLTTGQQLIVDLKTTASAEPDHAQRSLDQYGYHQQADWYIDGHTTLDLGGGIEPAFLFVFVEKSPPHLVTIGQPDPEALHWGRIRNRKARDVYRRCCDSGEWPGYTDQIVSLSLPGYAVSRHEAAHRRGDYDTAHDLQENVA